LPPVLRLATLVNSRFKLDTRACVMQSVHLDPLDTLCRALGVPALTQFIDLTALELRDASQLLGADGVEQSVDPDPVTGLDWGIEDTAWYPASVGLTSLEALCGHLQRNPAALSRLPDGGILLDTLEHWMRLLVPLEEDGGQFHLSAG